MSIPGTTTLLCQNPLVDDYKGLRINSGECWRKDILGGYGRSCSEPACDVLASTGTDSCFRSALYWWTFPLGQQQQLVACVGVNLG